MSRLFIGNLPGAGPVVKIMANDTDDPRTTPNDDWWKFRFNSETAAIGYAWSEYTLDVTSSMDGFYPPGSNASTCDVDIETFTTGNLGKQCLFNTDRIADNDTIMFYREVADDWRSNQSGFRAELQGDLYYYVAGNNMGNREGMSIGNYLDGSVWKFGAMQRKGNSVSGYHYEFGEWEPIYLPPDFSGLTVFKTPFPLDDDPYPAVTGSPASGKLIARLSDDTFKVAKPGFDIRSASDDELIVGHDKPPLMVAATGTLTLAPGASANVYSDLPLSRRSLVEYQTNVVGDPLYLPSFPDSDAQTLKVTYRVIGSPDRVQFKNEGSESVLVRYFIMAVDFEPQTSGSAKVLADDGYIRVQRPGSSTNPNLADILLDSRATYLPIVDQGWLDYPGDFTAANSKFGTHYHRVSLPSGDYVPYVLARAKFKIVGESRYFYSDFYWKAEGEGHETTPSSFMAHVTSGHIDFWVTDIDDHPYEDAYKVNDFNWAFIPGWGEIQGVRYFIFAVPDTL